nr:MAG TPA: hypothetical protein [Caudoviricetes sp.]
MPQRVPELYFDRLYVNLSGVTDHVPRLKYGRQNAEW